jgi:predicted CXXCH cytochrome family protein
VTSSKAAAVSAVAALAAGMALWACGNEPPPLSDTGAVAKKTAAAFFRAPKDRIPQELATNPGTPWGDYVGSKACQECHEKDYADWRQSFHSRTLYDAGPKTVIGDFEKTKTFKDPAMPYFTEARREGDKFFLKVWENPDFKGDRDSYGNDWLPAKTQGEFEVIYAFGNRRHQPYVAKLPDGYWVLPVYWNDADKTWLYDGWRHYTTSCAPCHVSGIKSLDAPDDSRGLKRPIAFPHTRPLKYVPPAADEGWAEGAVGCEVCHGPGKGHIAKARELGAEGYRAYLAGGGTPTIYCPKGDSPEMREVRMQQCDSCHNFFSESTVTWVPLPRGYDHPQLRDPIQYSKELVEKSQFYKDGTHMSPCTVGTVFRDSKMGRSGKVECASCHDNHGNASFGSLVLPAEGNRLCLSCHQDQYPTREAIAAHTRHDPDGIGSSCIECHMQRDKRFTNGVQVMSDHIPSHQFSIPTGDQRPGGPRPSCNVCHVDRDAAWSQRTISEWIRAKTAKPSGK